MVRIIALAHQIQAIDIDSATKQGGRKLKPLEHYLKPIERSRKRRRKGDQSDAVAGLLDRLASKSKPAAPPPHTNPVGAAGGKKRKTPGKD